VHVLRPRLLLIAAQEEREPFPVEFDVCLSLLGFIFQA